MAAEGEGRALGVMEINRSHDLGDIADPGMGQEETKRPFVKPILLQMLFRSLRCGAGSPQSVAGRRGWVFCRKLGGCLRPGPSARSAVS
jgi:hypothetical protein